MMVLPFDQSRLLLVLQIEHSQVAGYLAAHWGNDEFAEARPWSSVVLAAQEHDSGWWNWEIKPSLNQEGLPPDYQRFWMGTGGVTAGSEERAAAWVSFYRDGVDRLIETDRYAGLLALMHGAGLLSQGYGVRMNLPDMRNEPTAKAFLESRDVVRQRVLSELRQSPEYGEVATDEHIWTNYKLLEVYDQLAQFLTNRYPLNSTARTTGPRNVIGNVPMAPGKDDTSISIEVQDERRCAIRPYPFDVSPLEVSYPARLVPSGPFASREEFLRRYYKGERYWVTYTLHAPS